MDLSRIDDPEFDRRGNEYRDILGEFIEAMDEHQLVGKLVAGAEGTENTPEGQALLRRAVQVINACIRLSAEEKATFEGLKTDYRERLVELGLDLTPISTPFLSMPFVSLG
jgi:hypothetical protein